MEYIYSAMLLHKAGKNIDEASIKKVLEAAGLQPDDGRIKALVAALQGINIDETIKNASFAAPAAAAPAAGGAGPKEEKKKEEKKEDDKKSEEQAAAGLGALFG